MFINNLNFEGSLFSLTKTHGLVQVKLSAKWLGNIWQEVNNKHNMLEAFVIIIVDGVVL